MYPWILRMWKVKDVKWIHWNLTFLGLIYRGGNLVIIFYRRKEFFTFLASFENVPLQGIVSSVGVVPSDVRPTWVVDIALYQVAVHSLPLPSIFNLSISLTPTYRWALPSQASPLLFLPINNSKSDPTTAFIIIISSIDRERQQIGRLESILDFIYWKSRLWP